MELTKHAELSAACSQLAECLAAAKDGSDYDSMVALLSLAIKKGNDDYMAKFPAPIGRVFYKSGPTKDDPLNQGHWHDFSALTISPGRIEVTSMGVTKEIPIDAGEVSFHLRKPK